MPQAVTNRRVRRKAAALLAPQSGKGVLVDNFPAASAERLWSRELNVAIDDPKSLPGPWMTELETEGEGARYSIMERTAGKALVMATPKSVEYLLRSNWGPYGAGVLSLASQVSEYFTLAWIEDVASDRKALVMATPKSVEYLLRSNWGPYGAGVLSLASQVSEYFTLAWIEDVA